MQILVMILHSTHIRLIGRDSCIMWCVCCSPSLRHGLNSRFHDKLPDKYPFRTKEKVGDKMRSLDLSLPVRLQLLSTFSFVLKGYLSGNLSRNWLFNTLAHVSDLDCSKYTT